MSKTEVKPVIWHNPKCETSRNVLGFLREAGIEPEIIEYMQVGWTDAGLRALLAEAGISARQALRAKEQLAEDLGLRAEDVPEDRLIAAMIAHPVLVNRPFVRVPQGTKLCRPSETVLDLLGS
jgi:arsenate reductase